MFPYANKDKELPTAAKKGETEVFLAELEHLKTLANQTKKFIYRAGRTPDWVVGGGDDSDGEGEGEEGGPRPSQQKSERDRRAHQPERPKGVMKIKLEKDQTETLGRRIHRAQVVRSDEKETPVVGSKRSRAIEVEDEDQEVKTEAASAFKQQKSEPIPTPMEVVTVDTSHLEVPEDPADETEDVELDERRQRARERARAQALQEEKEKELKKPEGEGEGLEGDEEGMEDEERQKKAQDGFGEGLGEGGEEDEAENSEESDDEEAGDLMMTSRPLMKPVFVSKKERETIAERKRLEQEEQDLENAKKERIKERKTESNKMLIDEVKREEEADQKKKLTAGQGGADSDEDMPDDADGGDEKVQLDEWKIREMKRITRDKKERERYENERKEIARRRLLTDSEIEIENSRKEKPKRAEKGTYRFLQKYYHPGAFFQNPEESTQQRDFSAPTGEDRTVDRTLLPKVLQVKKFGLKGRTKYTHLVDQDTSLVMGPPGMWAQLKAVQKGAATQVGSQVFMNMTQTMTKEHTPGAAATPIPSAPGAFRPAPSEWNPWGKAESEPDFIHKRRLGGMGPLDRRTRGGHSKKKIKDDD